MSCRPTKSNFRSVENHNPFVVSLCTRPLTGGAQVLTVLRINFAFLCWPVSLDIGTFVANTTQAATHTTTKTSSSSSLSSRAYSRRFARASASRHKMPLVASWGSTGARGGGERRRRRGSIGQLPQRKCRHSPTLRDERLRGTAPLHGVTCAACRHA